MELNGSSPVLYTPEGVRFRPTILVENDAEGAVIRLEVGVRAHYPDGTIHTVLLVPSTATNEGHGTGNVFVYEDDEPVTHLAWGRSSDTDG